MYCFDTLLNTASPGGNADCNQDAIPASTQQCNRGLCPDPCAGVSCGNNGYCVNNNGVASCTCTNDCSGSNCQYRWFVGNYSACGGSCDQGVRKRLVQCINALTGVASSNPTVDCTAPRPDDTAVCALPACTTHTYSWAYTDWSACDAVCNGGTQFRQPLCVDSADSTVVVDSSLCADQTLQATSRACNSLPCTWSWGPWGACSKDCAGVDGGVGTRQRAVFCVNRNTGTIVSGSAGDALCNYNFDMPATSELCNSGPCKWLALSAWTECSKECNGGVSQRFVCCLDTNAGTCLANSAPCGPINVNSSRTCNTLACKWQAGDWGSCSAQCGGGQQSRAVTCVNPNTLGQVASSPSSCLSTKPATSQLCNNQTCSLPYWLYSDWGTCSVSCGGGSMNRSAFCAVDGAVVDSSQCALLDGPIVSALCNNQSCGVCYQVQCGTGTCIADRTAPNGRRCVCYQGWGGDVCDIAPSIHMTYPTANGALTAQLGSGAQILFTWAFSGLIDYTALYLFRVSTCQRFLPGFCIPDLVIATGITNTQTSNSGGQGSYLFSVPQYGVVPVGDDYYVQVRFRSDVRSESALFSLTGLCPATPCVNGTCVSGRCDCYPGFTGKLCNTSTDPCFSNPCQNGGVCSAVNGAPKCTCVSAFKGPYCSVPSSCELSCANGGYANPTCDQVGPFEFHSLYFTLFLTCCLVLYSVYLQSRPPDFVPRHYLSLDRLVLSVLWAQLSERRSSRFALFLLRLLRPVHRPGVRGLLPFPVDALPPRLQQHPYQPQRPHRCSVIGYRLCAQHLSQPMLGGLV